MGTKQITLRELGSPRGSKRMTCSLLPWDKITKLQRGVCWSPYPQGASKWEEYFLQGIAGWYPVNRKCPGRTWRLTQACWMQRAQLSVDTQEVGWWGLQSLWEFLMKQHTRVPISYCMSAVQSVIWLVWAFLLLYVTLHWSLSRALIFLCHQNPPASWMRIEALWQEC